MISTSEIQNEPYPWHWLGGLCLLFSALFYWMLMRSPIPVFHPEPLMTVRGEVHSVLLIRIPPAELGRPPIGRRADAWFAAMASAGYHVALLSEVHHRLSRGLGLPRKTAVLIFDPGSRDVFEKVAPLLAKYKFPAVWVTDLEAQQHGDRRYVSRHVWNAMKKSGCWDVGYYNDASVLVIESRDSEPIVIERGWGRRQKRADLLALNQGLPEGSLAWLHINWSWTGQKLAERLDADDSTKPKEAPSMKHVPTIYDQRLAQALR